MSTEIVPLKMNLPMEIEHVIDSSDSRQFLSFKLNHEYYGFDILKVCEIRGWQLPTLLPNSPDYIKGVINIRGNIVPIMNLREKFGFEMKAPDKSTVIIILSVNEGKNDRTMGIVVDSVSDVFNCNQKDIRKAPASDNGLDSAFIEGLCDYSGVTHVLINVPELLKLNEISEHYRTSVNA